MIFILQYLKFIHAKTFEILLILLQMEVVNYIN